MAASAPNLTSFLGSLRSHRADVSVEHLQALLKHRHIRGARRCAIAAAHLLITYVAELKPKDVPELLLRIRVVGRRLVDAQPNELTTGNITRRVLGLVREAADSSRKDGQSQMDVDAETEPKSINSIKEDVLDGLRELLDELDQADKQISESAPDYVLPQETILVFGASLTIQKFLLDAAKKRRFTVIQIEAHPNEHNSVQETLSRGARRNADDVVGAESRLKSLTTMGIEVTYMPDSSTFAVMSRVSKVLLSAQGLFADGASTMASGTSMVAKAARFHKVPVFVAAPVYRLSPCYHFDRDDSRLESEPDRAVSSPDCDFVKDVKVINSTRDLLSAKDTSLIITNIGGFSPDYIGRVAADHYRPEDTDI